MSNKICSGEAINRLVCIKSLYKKINCIIKKSIQELYDLINEINNTIDISSTQKHKYLKILKKLRRSICQYECNCEKDCEKNNHLLTQSQCLEFLLPNNEKLKVIIPGFICYNFLQMTDNKNNILFYKNNPNEIDYSEARKNLVKQDFGNNLIPVWFFKHDNLVTANYSFIIDKIREKITYDELLFKRVLLNKCFKDNNKKTIPAYCKYKFNYKCGESKLILKDPENPSIDILPQKQGVINGIYSFEDSLFNYFNKEIVINTINNTIKVLSQLNDFINQFIKQIEISINEFCLCN